MQARFNVINERGEKQDIVDLLNTYANYSRLPVKTVPPFGGQASYPLAAANDEAMKKMNGVPVANAYQIALIITVSKLMQKSRPHTFLKIGGQPKEFNVALSNLLAKFHESSTFYCLHEEAADNSPAAWKLGNWSAPLKQTLSPQKGFDFVFLNDWNKPLDLINFTPQRTIDWCMPYKEALLPQKEFDFVFLDDWGTEGGLPVDIIKKALLSLKLYGHMLLLSGRPEMKAAYRALLPECLAVPIRNNLYLLAGEASWLDWQQAYEGTAAYANKEQKKETCTALYALREDLREINGETAASAIAKAVAIERDVLQLYPELVSQDIRIRANELKAALIDFRFGHTDKNDLLAKYAALIAEAERYQDLADKPRPIKPPAAVLPPETTPEKAGAIGTQSAKASATNNNVAIITTAYDPKKYRDDCQTIIHTLQESLKL